MLAVAREAAETRGRTSHRALTRSRTRPRARQRGRRDPSADGLRAAGQSGQSSTQDVERRTGQVHRRGVRALRAHLPRRVSTPEGALLAAGSGAQRRRQHERARPGGGAAQLRSRASPRGQRSTAARKLLRYYRQADMDPPDVSATLWQGASISNVRRHPTHGHPR